MLFEEKMKPSHPDLLLEAFRLLDVKKDGFIEKQTFLDIMRQVGESMSEEELDGMLKAAVDPTDQKIYYETYINQLCHEPQPEDSIYELAKTFGKPSNQRRKSKFM